MTGLKIERLPHRDPDQAARIHDVQMAAYRQEAQLLGAAWFPPLQSTVTNIQASPGQFFGAFAGGELVGIAIVEPGGPNAIWITSLTVEPCYQRRGVGRALLSAIVSEYPVALLSVSTAANNHPALALYAMFGFVEVHRKVVGPESLVLVELSRRLGKAEG